MNNHLWYLSEEAVALAFFDSQLSYEEKRRMVLRLESQEPMIKLRNDRNYLNLKDLFNYNISDFVSKNTKKIFWSLRFIVDIFEI